MHPQNISDLGLVYDRGLLPYDGFLTDYGRVPNNGLYGFNPRSLFANGEQGVWYDPSDLTPEKVSWRRNLLTYSQDFENAAWTKSNASILSNLALYSQDFDNAAWAKTDITVTANTIAAPDGTLTADLLTAGVAGTDGCSQTLTSTANITHTLSFYAKRGNTDWLFMRFGDATNQVRGWWNLATGTAGTAANAGTATGATESIQDVGNGWYRCVLSGAVNGAVTAYAINGFCATADGSITRVNNSTRYMWGAQFLPGSTAQTYTRSLATAPSIMFADPLGGTMADKLVENTATTGHILYSTITSTAGVGYVGSVYVKAGERGFTQVRYENSGATEYFAVNVNLSNGTYVTGTSGSPTGTSVVTTDVGSGWWRVQLSANANNTSWRLLVYSQPVQGTTLYTGDGTSGIYVYGAQVEQASTASAYQRITNFNGDFSAAFPNHALYQESVGPSPVTALGQSVGLVLDKRLGPPGPELVANGTFADGTGWSFGTNWSLGNGVAAGIGASGNLRYAFTAITGATYRVQFDLTYNGGTLYVAVGSGTGVTFTASGTHVAYVVCGASPSFGVDFYGGSITGFIDNVSVRLVSGNHALQATSAARPTLQARSNLLIASEQFDTWTLDLATVTANSVVAPDGTATGDTLTATTTGANVRRSVTFTGDGEKCVSVYLKAGTSTQSRVSLTGAAGVNRHAVRVTWASGVPTLSTIAGSGTLYPVESLANGWYRILFSATGIIAAESNNVRVIPDDIVGTGTVYAWGAQAENATVPTTYQRVTTATDYADVGLPRNLTFDGVDDSLATAGNVDFATWTVGTRRNLLTVPTMFDDAAWQKTNVTVTANTVTAPDGTTTADKIEAATAAATSVLQNVGVINATSVTFSFYGKQGSGATDANKFDVYNVTTLTDLVVFNVNWSTGVVTVTSGSATTTSTDAGNGWWRITATVSSGITSGNSLRVYAGFTGATETANEFSYLWGAQLEVGSTATAFQDVGTDKVTLFSGVTKLSDAAYNVIAELGTNPQTTDKSFGFGASTAQGDVTLRRTYGFVARGTTTDQLAGVTTYAAPSTNVISAGYDIGAALQADQIKPRVNGAVPTISAINTTTPAGPFISAPIYIGRRSSSVNFFTGRLFQLVIRGAATGSDTVRAAERWVGRLTGVQL